MAGLRKDVELIFRGQDRATPTINGVRDSVRDLTKAVGDQLAAVERGEGSLDELTKTYKRLKDAQGDVGEITRLATAYESLAAKHKEQADKAAAAAAKEEELNAEIARAANPTKRLQAQRDAASRAAAAAAAKEQELAAAVKAAGEAFEAAGGDVKQFERSQDQIRAAALETARGIQAAAAAIDDFGAAAAKGAQFKASLDEAQRFNALAAGSGLPEAQIKFISALENRIEALTAAMRENEASAQRMNREIADNSANAAAQRIREMTQTFVEGEQAAQRLEAAMQFKNQAASIAAAARDVSRFGMSSDTAATSARRLADTIQAISTPTQTAARSLEGVNGILDRAEGLFDGTKRRMSEYNAAINDLTAAQAGLGDMARLIDNFRDQEVAVNNARQAMNVAQTEVLQLAAAIRQAENPTQEMANSLARAEANLEKTGGALQRETTKLRQLETALEAAKIDVTQLATAEAGLEAAATRAAAAQTRLAGVSRGVGGFMGLNPNELQNLGFQVNDVIVSIASGQNPLTVFIQQGSQIAQIWPGALSKIAARAPAIAAILAVLIPLGATLGEAAEDSRRLSEATNNIQSMGGAVQGLDASKLAQMAEGLEEIGVKADEANTAMRDLMADGLNGAQMEQYIQAAKDASKVTGEDFKTSLDQLRDSLQGGYEDILALQDATGVYDQKTLDLIATLYEQGKADEARALALAAFSNQMGDAAAQADGPWKRAISNLGQAWNNFVNWLSNTAPIRIAADWLNRLGQIANYWSARLAGKDAKTAMAESQGLNPKSVLPAAADANRKTTGGQQAIKEAKEALEQAKAVTAAEKRALEVRKARNAAISEGATNLEAENVARLAGATFDAQEAQRQEKRDAAAAKRRDGQRKREQRAAEAAARQIASLEEQLQRQLEQLDSAVGNKQQDNLERRLNAIDSQYEKLFRSIDEYSAKTGGKGLIDGRTIEAAREHVRIQLQQLKNYETMEFRESELQKLMQERSEKLDAIADKVARAQITPDEGLRQSKVVIDEIAAKTTEMATKAIAFAEALRGAVPSPQLDAFIAKMQTALQNNAGGDQRTYNEVFTKQVEAAEARMNSLIQQRNALIDTETAKVQLGLQTRQQAQANIMDHYRQTAPLILQHIDQIEALAAAYSGGLTPQMKLYFDTLRAKMAQARVEVQGTDASFNNWKQSLTNVLSSNIIGFVDAVAQAFARLATKQDDVLGTLAAIGIAFLRMIANILQMVAQLIISALILSAVDKATGGILKPMLQLLAATAPMFHSGGVVGDSSNGRRSRQISPLAFAGAPQYHSGGIVGLAANEQAAILKKGEEVLTENDPRHVMNGGLGGGGGGGARAIRNVLAIGDDEVASAIAGAAGEEVVLTHIRRNSAAIASMLDRR